MKQLGSKNERNLFVIETEDNIPVWCYSFLRKDYKTEVRKAIKAGDKIYEVLSPNPEIKQFLIVVFSEAHKRCQKFKLNKTVLSSNFLIFDENSQINFDYLTYLPLELIPEELEIKYSEIKYGKKFIIEKILN